MKIDIPDYTHEKLENGLDVVIIPKDKTPVVSMNMAYKVGSKNEVWGNTGFAHLFEHLMFEGTKNAPKGSFDKYCSTAGGTNNAYTTYDLTSYIMALPAHQLELGLWLESDRLYNFEVTQEALDNQKSVVTEEIRQTVENQPYGRWRELLAQAAFDEKCSYAWEVHGSIKDVANSKIEDTRKFFRTFYQPKNACLTLVGDVEPDDALSLVKNYFGEIKSGAEKIREYQFLDSFRKKGEKASYKDSVPFNATFLSFHTAGFKDDKIYNADVLGNIFGGGRSSRLYNSLVHEKQIATFAGAFVDKREDGSLVTLVALGNDPGITSDQLAEEIQNEIANFKDNGFKEKELEKSRNQLSTQIAYEMQRSGGAADLVGHRTLFWGDPSGAFDLLDKYLAVSEDDIKALADKILIPEEAVRVDVNPKES